MAATFGVNQLHGLTVPSGGYAQETSSEDSVEVATVRNASGVTVKAVPKKVVTSTYTLKGKGGAALTAVTAGAMTAGTMKIVSVKNSESNDDFADFEITGKKYSNI